MGKPSRLLLGFTLAPMPPFLLFCVLAAVYAQPPDLLSIAGVFALATHGLTLLFGLPSHIVLRRFGWRRLWHYLVAALALPVVAVAGVFMMGVFDAVTGRGGQMIMQMLVTAMTMTPAALVTAGLFWLIVVWRSAPPGGMTDAALAATFE